jgi:hypothetical protein
VVSFDATAGRPANAQRSPAKAGAEKKAPNGKAAAQTEEKPRAPKAEKAAEAKVTQAELDALRKPVEAAKGGLEKAEAEAKALAEKARAVVAEAKDAYRAALTPYREACHKAGVECEYEGGRSANVSDKVSFLVEKTEKGVRVMVKGQPKTEEVIPLAALKESVNKAAYAYTDKYLGPKEEIGNKGGSLSNRLRAVMAA